MSRARTHRGIMIIAPGGRGNHVDHGDPTSFFMFMTRCARHLTTQLYSSASTLNRYQRCQLNETVYHVREVNGRVLLLYIRMSLPLLDCFNSNGLSFPPLDLFTFDIYFLSYVIFLSSLSLH